MPARRSSTSTSTSASSPRCAEGCRSLERALGRRAGADDHAFTCAACGHLVCAMCGTTPVEWAGYICRGCVAPAPARHLTAGQLRAALAGVADDTVLTPATLAQALRQLGITATTEPAGATRLDQVVAAVWP
ncbi:hypothetical protein [Marinitenerispora sediminis]|uniref:Uncharacterized protein n=1 Tax=Marinitenerispora sediminis TaxID=1931232 RepID=A0A368T777_9ACTN|nr:hypothetical protein [Marinitenerispora sediminis]RCV54644.1 hypothetical protein DEF23_15505 [Marinitenerispora sediminis]RCV56400.1 hypothetical protein DEF28_03580 [Marinitenerispora sediminis]RCV59744.1 hypothetical protein DEF24_08905 [Marinitenerispora sediminis]